MIDERFDYNWVFYAVVCDIDSRSKYAFVRYQTSIELVQQLRIDSLHRIRNLNGMKPGSRFEASQLWKLK